MNNRVKNRLGGLALIILGVSSAIALFKLASGVFLGAGLMVAAVLSLLGLMVLISGDWAKGFERLMNGILYPW